MQMVRSQFLEVVRQTIMERGRGVRDPEERKEGLIPAKYEVHKSLFNDQGCNSHESSNTCIRRSGDTNEEPSHISEFTECQ